MPSTTARVLITLLLGAAAAASWWAWMAWDHNYQRDPATGEMHGPYQAWQVGGCVLTLLALGLYGAIRWHPLTVTLMPICFTLAWSWTAAPTDDTGLWVAGAILVLIGTSVGAFLVGLLGLTVRKTGSSR